jgi:hypothetical protein
MRTRTFLSLLTMAVVAIALCSAAGCTSKTPLEVAVEKIKRAKSDTSLSDDEAIKLLAEGYFSLQDYDLNTESKGVSLVVNGWDASTMPEIGADTQELARRMRRVQLYGFLESFQSFIRAAEARNLGAVDLTLQTATFSPDGSVWVPTYAFDLEPNRFAAFLKLYDTIAKSFGSDAKDSEAVFDRSFRQMEKVWKVKLDNFQSFTYERR